MKHFAMIAWVLVACGATAQAVPTATFSVTTSGSNWYLWCSTDSQSNGLVSFILDLNGTSGTQILTSAIKAPRYFSQALDYSAGFAAYASGGVVSAGNVTGIQAGQGSMYGDTPNPLADARVIQGIGQVAGGAIGLTENGPMPVSWDAPCLLAQGTYSGQGSFAAVNMDGNFLSKVNGDSWAGPGNVEAGNWEFTPMHTFLALLHFCRWN